MSQSSGLCVVDVEFGVDVEVELEGEVVFVALDEAVGGEVGDVVGERVDLRYGLFEESGDLAAAGDVAEDSGGEAGPCCESIALTGPS